MALRKDIIQVGDLVIIDYGILGKYAYEVTKDLLSIRLREINNNHSEKVFHSFSELEEFIASDPERISWVSMQ